MRYLGSVSRERERTERLLNLLIALKSTRSWISRASIRSGVEGYQGISDEAFDRQFSRDKDALRALGIDIVTRAPDDFFGEDESDSGYRVEAEGEGLSDMTFTPAEAEVVAIAARWLQRGVWWHEAGRAVTKLQGLGAGVDVSGADVFGASSPQQEPVFRDAYDALRTRTTLTFDYRKPGRSAETRTVSPWGILTRRERAYLAGFDHDRQAPRVFRLGRVIGAARPARRFTPGDYEIPADFDVRALLRGQNEEEAAQVATVWVAPGKGGALRRAAAADDGDTVRIPYGEDEHLASEIAQYGPDARVLEPATLRDAVAEHLREVLRRLPAEGPDEDVQPEQARDRKPRPPSRRTDASDRLTRLLSLVPWLSANPGVSPREAAAHFEIGEEELVDDLNLLFVSGRPGHLPDDLIEVYWDENRIEVSNAEEIATPMNLSAGEALSLIVALRALEGSAALADRAPVAGAIAKLESATGGPVEAASAMAVELPEVDGAIHAALAAAVRDSAAVEIDYYVASRDEQSTRVISPYRLLTSQGNWYADAYCHAAEGDRRFRLDRITGLRPGPAQPPARRGRTPRPSDEALPHVGDSGRLVRLGLEPFLAWLAEEVPAESVRHHDDGSLTVVLRIVEPAWLSRLLLRYGPGITEVAPVSVAADARERAARAVADASVD